MEKVYFVFNCLIAVIMFMLLKSDFNFKNVINHILNNVSSALGKDTYTGIQIYNNILII